MSWHRILIFAHLFCLSEKKDKKKTHKNLLQCQVLDSNAKITEYARSKLKWIVNCIGHLKLLKETICSSVFSPFFM